tara:strand:+ start:160 stop:1902 length:1743 start_codon:yes stop_codon:yes gene_type:complete
MALTKVSGSILKDPLNLGEVSIGGTLTYEDVTNVDSIGIITARSSIDAQGIISLAESIVHTGDTNTKISFPANDEISLDTTGHDRIYIKSDGKIGMGTVTPAVAIHHFTDGLNGNTLRLENREGYVSFTNDADILSVDANSHHFRNRAGSTEFARISSTGQLLLGLTSSLYHFHAHDDEKTAEISVANDSSNYRVALNTTNRTNADFNVQHKQGLTSIGTGVNIPLCFHINGATNANSAEKMRLDTAGTLHIKGGNIEAGDDSFNLNYLDSISNYIGVAADGGSNGGDALFMAHSHGSGLAIFGYEAGGDRLVIATDAGGGGNKIDFITDAGTSTNTDNLNGKVPKMRIAANGVITLGSPTNTVLKAEVCNAVSGHQFISQCSDNNNGFEVYQKHGSTTTRNTFATYANTGSGASKEIQFSVRGDGRLFKGGHQIYPVIQIHQARISGSVSNSATGTYQDIKNLVTFTPLKSGSMVHVQVICQTWNGSQSTGSADAYARLQHNNGGSYTTFTECDRVQGNFQYDKRYTHNPFIMDGWFTTTTTNATTIKFQGNQAASLPVAFNWFHAYGGRITLMEYDIT